MQNCKKQKHCIYMVVHIHLSFSYTTFSFIDLEFHKLFFFISFAYTADLNYL